MKHALDLLTAVRDDITEDSARHFTNPKLLRIINRAYVKVFEEQANLLEGRLTTVEDIDLVSGTRLYSPTANIHYLQFVQVLDSDGNYHTIEELPSIEAQKYDGDWPSDIDTDAVLYQWYYHGKQIGLAPVPGVSRVSGLRLNYIPFPGELHIGTAATGATTSITLDSDAGNARYGAASVQDDAYNGHDIMILAGTGIGQRATITDYVGSTKVASAVFTVAPDATSQYAIFPRCEAILADLIVVMAAHIALRRIDPEASIRFGKAYEYERRNLVKSVALRSVQPWTVRPDDDTYYTG